MTCIECGQDKKIVAFGLCRNCYNHKTRDKVNAASKRWKEKNPDKCNINQRPEHSLKNNSELLEKCNRARIENIYRKHDEDLKDDPDRLNIRELVEGKADYFQFRST